MKYMWRRITAVGLSVMLLASMAAGCGKRAESKEEQETNEEIISGEYGTEELETTAITVTPTVVEEEPVTPEPETEPVSTSEQWEGFAQGLKDKYQGSETVTYSENVYYAAKDEEFYIDCRFDPFAAEIESYFDIVGIYTDPELTNVVSAEYTWADDQRRAYIISPGDYTAFDIYDSDVEEGMLGYTPGSGYLYNDAENDWGNIGTLYMAQWRDLDTGEVLDKPIVTVINIESELEAPIVHITSTDEGIARLEWDAIDGAQEYWVIEYDTDENGKVDDGAILLGRTADTYWEAGEVESGEIMNQDFNVCLISEEDWLSEAIYESYKDKYNPADGPVLSTYYRDVTPYIAVIAVNDKDTSMISNSLPLLDLAAMFVYSTTYVAGISETTGERIDFHTDVYGVSMLPAYRYVTMCDGKMVPRLLEYDCESAEEVTEQYLFWEDDNDIAGTSYFEYVEVLKVPYRIEGTPFTGYISVEEYDRENWQRQLSEVQERQEQLRNRTGTLQYNISMMDESQILEGGSDVTVDVSEDAVTANSALSEYLAVSMISSVEYIDLTMFPEANDMAYLTDAWMEAVYQNPLTLGVDGAYLSENRKGLYIIYQEDVETRARKQEEIRAEVARIIDEIITDDMTDLEKEYAINQYLCESAEYDMAALENAEQYDFATVDPEFDDSFNAYGILINKVGVCASYAASFKLLADEAGLESIVVTGYLDGATPHAWNRVYLDGNWETIDVTNNDNEYLSNALLNMPDYALNRTLVEDSVYILDAQIGEYISDNADNEYYRVTGNYYDMETIVNEFVERLAVQDTVVLRTDYALTEDEFYDIAYAVMDELQNYSLGGCYWLGTIVLTTAYE